MEARTTSPLSQTSVSILPTKAKVYYTSLKALMKSKSCKIVIMGQLIFISFRDSEGKPVGALTAESINLNMDESDVKDVEMSTEKKADHGEERQEPEYPSLAKVMIIISALYLAVFLVALDQTIIGVAIPKITDQFKSISDIAWYGSAYFLTSTALQPSYGRIYKVFSVRVSPDQPYFIIYSITNTVAYR